MKTRAALALVALSAALVTAQGTGTQPVSPNAARDLRGAIDIHVHADPDRVPRVLDVMEAVKQAKEAGLRGIVLKSHWDPTAGLAMLTRKYNPGIEVFGGIDLNLPVGGMNVDAVENMAQANGGWGRIVWMSTFDSEAGVSASKANRPFVRVSQNGQLLPATKAVIAAIAKHNLILASGHTSAQEALMMFAEGRKVGVRGMVATHGMSSPTSLTIDQAREAAKLGAFIEFTGDTMIAANSQGRVDRMAQQIRALGVEYAIISSDLGKGGAELPVVGLASFMEALRNKGFTNQELDRMAKQNPARLLGLKEVE